MANTSEVEKAEITVNLKERIGSLNMSKVASLGQGGFWDEPIWEDRIEEIRALRPAIIRLFIQEYFHLLPQPGKYDFSKLDRYIEAILKTGAKPLMCITIKPRALYPEINHDIVEPNDWEEWKRLIFNLVKHYKDKKAGIRYWEISNEPDLGEGGGCPYRFKPEEYIRYYRETAEAILKADSSALVGGPALAYVGSPILTTLLEHCDKENIPIHFVSWHIYTNDPLKIRETIEYVRGLLGKYPRLELETILDEWNMDLGAPSHDPRFQPCFVAEAIYQMVLAGLDYSCYYHIRDYKVNSEKLADFMSPEGIKNIIRFWNEGDVRLGLYDFDNRRRPVYFTFKLLSEMSGERLELISNHPQVHGFATYDEKEKSYKLMLWNFSEQPITCEIKWRGFENNVRLKHIVLEAEGEGMLREEGGGILSEENDEVKANFEPYAVHFWSLEMEKR
ncbi:beta-galactosidase [bacterium]|nr:beta-galactosidase [bacterium]